MESHDIVKNLLKKVPAKHVAQELGVSLSLVYKWAEAPIVGSGTSNPLDRIEVLARLAQDMAPLEWLCTRFDGSFVKRPDIEVTTEDFIYRVSQVMMELGRVLGEYSKPPKGSDKFTIEKVREIRMRWERAKDVIEKFLAAAEHGHYSAPPFDKNSGVPPHPPPVTPVPRITPVRYKRSLGMQPK